MPQNDRFEFFGSLLEVETDTNLNLATGVGKVAVGARRSSKGGVKGECGRSGSASHDVPQRTDASYVCAVEEVEAFSEDFQVHAL